MYIDTSCIVAFYVPEVFTERVDNLIRNSERIYISKITEIEFLSALNKKVRMGFFTPKETRIAYHKFEEHISNGFYKQIEITDIHYESALELLFQSNTGLRTLDAIHLGIVQKERLTIASNDAVLIESAQKFNIPSVSV